MTRTSPDVKCLNRLVLPAAIAKEKQENQLGFPGAVSGTPLHYFGIIAPFRGLFRRTANYPPEPLSVSTAIL